MDLVSTGSQLRTYASVASVNQSKSILTTVFAEHLHQQRTSKASEAAKLEGSVAKVMKAIERPGYKPADSAWWNKELAAMDAAQLKPVFGEFETQLKFIKFGLRYRFRWYRNESEM